ncbi:hypothetical protein LFREDSHE_33190 [Shewanella baltica]
MNCIQEKILFILKTSNFKYDQRVHKEASLLLNEAVSVSFIVKSADKIILSEYLIIRY